MENEFAQPSSKSPWFWIFMCVLVLAVTQCTREDSANKAKEEADLKAWQTSPEGNFRFCITTATGGDGQATPEQITACNKAAGR